MEVRENILCYSHLSFVKSCIFLPCFYSLNTNQTIIYNADVHKQIAHSNWIAHLMLNVDSLESPIPFEKHTSNHLSSIVYTSLKPSYMKSVTFFLLPFLACWNLNHLLGFHVEFLLISIEASKNKKSRKQ